MPVARSVHEVFDYVLQGERGLPVEKQTVFTLRRLSTRHHARAQSLTDSLPAMWEFVLRAGIAGWRNFADETGQPVECKHEKGEVQVQGITVKEPLAQDCLDLLPFEVTSELLAAITQGNTLTADDVKN